MTHELRAWGPAAAWAGVLFLLSSIPGSAVSWVPSGKDLLLHLGAYLVLGAALAWGRRRSGRAVPHWSLVLIGSAYGITDEWHQAFVAGRFPAVADWVADTLGVMLGYGLVLVLRNRAPDAGVERDRSPAAITDPSPEGGSHVNPDANEA